MVYLQLVNRAVIHCLMSWGDCDPQKKNDKYALPSTSIKVIIRWKGEMFMIDCFKTWKY